MASGTAVTALLWGCGGVSTGSGATTNSATSSTATTGTSTATSSPTSTTASSSTSTGQTDAGDAGGADSAISCDSLAGDFTTTGVNPNGVWSYGWSQTLGAAFTSYTVFSTMETDIAPGAPGMVGWSSAGASLSPPLADFNPNAVAVHAGYSSTIGDGTTIVPPGATDIHPGPQGQYSIARWTARRAGTLAIQATFLGESGYNGCTPTTTDVHVQHNGADIVSGYLNVNGGGNTYAATPAVTVATGDTVDFAVGYGNGTNTCDSTEVDAVVCPAP